MRRKMVAGNWKMNGGPASAQVVSDIAVACPTPGCDVLICPPAPLIAGFAALNSGIAIGAQDCHAEASGAHTGDIAAELLAECGASAIIVGHSERRADHHETDAQVEAKARAAWRVGLIAIICVGETEAQKTSGQTLDVIGSQLAGSIPDGATPANTVVAYEPVWAIGTGLTPTLDDIAEVHAFIRKTLTARFGKATADALRLLYGGSVKALNAVEIFAIPDVDGGLVGGASLGPADFIPIINAAG